jgi:large subunit ribosomal protein L10
MEGSVEMSLEAKSQKAVVVNELRDRIQASSGVFLADYRGLSVAKMTSLRKQLKKEGAQVQVVKNTLTKRAFDELGVAVDPVVLEGPSALINTGGDAVTVAKLIVKFSADNGNSLRIKAGVVDGAVFDEVQVVAFSKLPSREELLAKLVGTIKAPLTNLVGVLSNPLRNIVGVLDAVKEKKEQG